MAFRCKKIVIAVGDPYQPTSPAVRKGAEVAARCGATVELVHAFASFPRAFVAAPPADLGSPLTGLSHKERKEQLERLAGPLRRRGLRVRTSVLWDTPPHEALVRHVRESKADLLMADSHRHARVARLFLTNTDWELIRNCPCPLWLVKSPRLPRKPRVLAAVDPMHANAKPARLDDRISEAALAVARAVRGKAALFHSISFPLVYDIGGIFGEPIPAPIPPGAQRRYELQVEKALNALGRRHGIRRNACLLQYGEASYALYRAVRRGRVDLLVMGAVSRSALDRLLIGSTAERVMDAVNCDLLVIKPAGFRSRVPARKRREHVILG
jgi:universal stress protein E